MEQQQPGIDKKAVAAILLCAVIWAVWMNTNYRRTQALAVAAKQKAIAAQMSSGGTLTMTGTSGGVLAAVTPSDAEPGVVLPTGVAPAATVTLENDLLTVELSTHGARPVGATLKDPKYVENHLAALVTPQVPNAKNLAPLAPWFGDAAESRIDANATFLVATSAAGTVVVLEHRGADGFALTRTYKMGGAYTLSMTEQYVNRGVSPVSGRPGVLWAVDEKKAVKGDLFEPGAAVNARYQYKPPKNADDEKRTYAGPVEFVAISDRYFTAAVAPVEPRFDGTDSVRFRRPAKDTLQVLGLGEKITLAPGESKTFTYELYLGPKDYKILRNEGHNLAWVMNWGRGQGFFWAFIGVITQGLWYALGFFHQYVGNWGFAIILLTLLMRGLLWPLAAKQMRTANEFAQKSAKLKPQVDKIREKHGADPMEMNKQTMALYKQYGISPFSPLAGCLPLLLQLPIWWALYRVLWTSIDLRGAPFILWINDLSQPEKLFAVAGFDFRLMPILLGAVTWLQMKLTPQAGTDPVQQKMMMYMMPVMFTFFMWSLPAGLVVYIFTSTLMGIVQQYLLKRKMTPPAEAT